MKKPPVQAIPEVVQIEGDRYSLYASGLKRGHAESLEECASNLRNAADYYQAQIKDNEPNEEAVNVGLTMCDAMRRIAADCSSKAKQCSAEARNQMGAALAQKKNDEMRLRFPKPDQVMHWLANRFSR